jgi:hypothetical protein
MSGGPGDRVLYFRPVTEIVPRDGMMLIRVVTDYGLLRSGSLALALVAIEGVDQATSRLDTDMLKSPKWVAELLHYYF